MVSSTMLTDEEYASRLSKQREKSLEAACRCAQMAEDFRGKETVVLDLTEITPIADYFVITTATNPRQIAGLIDEVRKTFKAKKHGVAPLEGTETGAWTLQDFGDIVLHVFLKEARELYDLEHLWADAGRIDWKQYLASHPDPVNSTE